MTQVYILTPAVFYFRLKPVFSYSYIHNSTKKHTKFVLDSSQIYFCFLRTMQKMLFYQLCHVALSVLCMKCKCHLICQRIVIIIHTFLPSIVNVIVCEGPCHLQKIIT